MGFPTYTEEQKTQIREFIKSSSISFEDVQNDTMELHTTFYRLHEQMIDTFNAKGVPTNENGWFETMIRSGALRDGNGEKLPANWGIEDLLLYMQDKSAQLESLKENDPQQYEQEKNRMFLLCAYNPETKAYEGEYQGINIDNFFNADKSAVGSYFGEMTLTDTKISIMEANIPSIAEEEQAQHARQTIWIGQNTAEIQKPFVDAIRTLRKDLRRMDSIFSSDSREYVNFKTALDDLYHRLDQGVFQTPEDFYNAFSAKDEVSGKSVLDYAADYENAKRAKQGTLSDRQMGRMSICSRLRTIDRELRSATAEERATAIADSVKNLRLDAVAHKAMLGSLKHIGNNAARNIYKDAQNYGKQLAMVKSALSAKSDATLSALEAETSSTKVAEKLTPGTIKKDKAFKREHEEASSALNNLDKNQVPMTMVAQYLLDRSSSMLDDLEAADNFSHSDEYIAFRNSIAGLHRAIAGIAAHPEDFGPEKLSNALGEAVNAANLYQIRHNGDQLDTYEPNVTRRLGLGSELKICKDFLDNYRNTLIPDLTQDVTELFQRLSVHQDKMRELELESKYLGSLQLGDRLSAARGGGRMQSDAFYQGLAKKLNELVASDYVRTIQNEAKENFKDMDLTVNDKQNILHAVSKNKSLADAQNALWNSKSSLEKMKEILRLSDNNRAKHPEFLGIDSDKLDSMTANYRNVFNFDIERQGISSFFLADLLKKGYDFDSIMDPSKLISEKQDCVESVLQKIQDPEAGKELAEDLVAAGNATYNYVNEKLANLKDLSVQELTKPENKNILIAQGFTLAIKQELERKPTQNMLDRAKQNKSEEAEQGKAKEAKKGKPQKTLFYNLYLDEKGVRDADAFMDKQIDSGIFTSFLSESMKNYVDLSEGKGISQNLDQVMHYAFINSMFKTAKANGLIKGKDFFNDIFSADAKYAQLFKFAGSYIEAGRSNEMEKDNVIMTDFTTSPELMKDVADFVFSGKVKLQGSYTKEGDLKSMTLRENFNKAIAPVVSKAREEKLAKQKPSEAKNNEDGMQLG